MEFTQEQLDAMEEFRHHAREYVEARKSGNKERIRGTKYALDMDTAACQILGLDPECITPDGYEELTDD